MRGGDKVWGAVAAFQQLRLEQLRPLRAAGGLPGQGPRWLPARPAAPRLGAGLSLITRDLTWPGGREGLRLRRGAGGEGEVRPQQSLAPGFPPGHRPEDSPRGALFPPPRPLPTRGPRPGLPVSALPAPVLLRPLCLTRVGRGRQSAAAGS